MKKAENTMFRFTHNSLHPLEVEELRRLRHTLHENPELSEQEHRTTKLLRDEIRRLGLEEVELGLPTGLAAVLHGGISGPMVALRADIDALPVAEKTGWEHASKETGKMHACGHDIHMTALLGAAMLLSRHRGELCGDVVFIFQPAEESMMGAEQVIAAGLFEKLPICAMFGMHVWPQFDFGTIGLHTGAVMAAKDVFTITVQGDGGHASAPQCTHDSIVCGAHLIVALQSIVSRSISPLENAVVSVCSAHAGSCDNVIPDEMTLLGSTRTFSTGGRETVLQRIGELSDAIAAAYGCRASLSVVRGSPAVINSAVLADVAYEAASTVFGDSGTFNCGSVSISEDFSLYGGNVPTYYYLFGVRETGTEMPSLHNPCFCPNDRVLPAAAALLADSACAYFARAGVRSL